MKLNYVHAVLLIFCLLPSVPTAGWGQSDAISPNDCVNVRYITGVWMGGEGKQIAYLVKSSDISRNDNVYQLYIRDVDDLTRFSGRLIASEVNISDVQWLDGDRRIAFATSRSNKSRITIIDVLTGAEQSSINIDARLGSFSIDSPGNTIAYSVFDKADDNHMIPSVTSDQIAAGYRVTYLETVTSGFEGKSIYLTRRNGVVWSKPQPITLDNPFTHKPTAHFEYARNLSMSPDGKKLFLTYMADGIPERWKENPWIRQVAASLPLMETMILYDVKTGGSALAFETVNAYCKPRWSADSRFYFLNAHSPVGSEWEARDIRDHQMSPRDVNLFRVDATSGAISEVFRHVPPSSYNAGPLFIKPDGDVVLQVTGTAVVNLRESGGEWKESERIAVAKDDNDWFQSIVSNGTEIFGVHETVTQPEDIFEYKDGESSIRILTEVNPQLAHARFAPVERTQWTTSEGLNITGLLFLPPDYVAGKRYPLVIQTKGDSGWFTCDSGANHDPSFAPQPIATSGIIYLARSFNDNWNYQEEINKRPTGYPGGISEAVQAMNIWEGAVESLNQRGMIDPAKVGIIGFSRTGWEVEFDLVHSNVHYAAATAADNVQYSLSDYWLLPWATKDTERMYEGPPYGKPLENWKKYSISFNLDKVHTPLLMEEMGYNVHDDKSYSLPLSLAVYYEVAKGLTSLGKPVEMYYYPDEDHQLDHPRARLTTLQRSLDWYRFWLQGYERPNPEDPDQYKRWEHLRELRDADSKAMEQNSSNLGISWKQ
jgi:dipeptidyl aminopeptidase/acylaminoacyl peptidase